MTFIRLFIAFIPSIHSFIHCLYLTKLIPRNEFVYPLAGKKTNEEKKICIQRTTSATSFSVSSIIVCHLVFFFHIFLLYSVSKKWKKKKWTVEWYITGVAFIFWCDHKILLRMSVLFSGSYTHTHINYHVVSHINTNCHYCANIHNKRVTTSMN